MARSVLELPADAQGAVAGRALRVLLVEDFHVNQILVSGILKRRKCEIRVAENGRQAVELFEPGRYDLVLMDVQMPEMDGYEATDLIRQKEEAGVHTVIVAMTAHAMKGDRERCLDAGMDGYIAKPFDPWELLDLVDRLQGRRQEKDAQPAAAEASVPLPPRQDGSDAAGPVDRVYALRLAGGDEALLAVINDAFLGDCPGQVDRIGEALASRDSTQAARSAHALKGLLGGVGALEAQTQARELEALARKGDWGALGERLPGFEQSLDAVVRALRPGVGADT